MSASAQPERRRNAQDESTESCATGSKQAEEQRFHKTFILSKSDQGLELQIGKAGREQHQHKTAEQNPDAGSCVFHCTTSNPCALKISVCARTNAANSAVAAGFLLVLSSTRCASTAEFHAMGIGI